LACGSSSAKVVCRRTWTLGFELERTLRRLKPQRRAKPLVRRPDDEVPLLAAEAGVGPPLLLDTTIYVDVLQGRSPPDVDELLRLRTCQHSAVCLAELTRAFGRLDPNHPGTAAALEVLAVTLGDIPAHRLAAPNVEVWGEAGVLAGLLFRLGGYQRGQERACLNDALIFLQARRLGCVLLSANLRDFDLLDQLLPGGRMLLYRRA
jgi:predicted nucleic acid-binding protein